MNFFFIPFANEFTVNLDIWLKIWSLHCVHLFPEDSVTRCVYWTLSLYRCDWWVMLERLTDWTEIPTCCMGSERMLDDDLGAVVVLQLMYVSRSLKKSVVCLCVADTALQTLCWDFFFLPSCVWNLMSKQQWWWSTSGIRSLLIKMNMRVWYGVILL